MRIDNHYDDEILIAMLDGDPEALEGDPHLDACDSCRGILDNVRFMVDALRDDCIWDRQELNDAPVPETIALLRATAAQMNAEDTQAEVYLADMLAGSRETWLPKLEQHPEWRTAGVVRALVARADKQGTVMPPDALEMTKIATAIADQLSTYRAEVLTSTRGEAWRERAYAELYVGAFGASSQSVFAADSYFDRSGALAYQSARADATHALTLAALDRSTEALDTIRKATEVFEEFGDEERSRIAREAEAWIRAVNSDYRGALRIWLDNEARVEAGSLTHAGTFSNIAICYRELGDLPNAVSFYERALAIYSRLDEPVSAARLRWSLGSLHYVSGRWSDALRAFDCAKQQLLRLGMPFEAVLVDLDVSEVLLTIGCPEAVETICRDAVRYFKNEGLAYSRNALTALAFLSEAAACKRARPGTANQIRRYIEKLPETPDLLFLPEP